MYKICIVCEKEYQRSSRTGDLEWKNRKYCGHSCYWKNKHDKPWNKGIKMTRFSGDKSSQWKGENAKYIAKHMWVSKMLGKPSKCNHCRSTDKKKYEWANISGEYKRNLDDWIRLCTSCHRKFDRSWLLRQRDVLGRFI